MTARQVSGKFDEPSFAPIFKGWNVWAVFQVQDLDFSIAMIGVPRDRQLRIWVEDAVRLGAGGTDVADPLDLKGSKIEIIPSSGTLKSFRRKEQVPGPAMVVETQDQPPELRFVRFFNRGDEGRLTWPHDDNYLLDDVFTPDPKNELTAGPAPGTIADSTTKPARDAVVDVLKTALWVSAAGVAVYAAYTFVHGKALSQGSRSSSSSSSGLAGAGARIRARLGRKGLVV
jgi:hypothetical protein